MTLKAPVSGRVEYRLAQAGEVVAAGGRVLTLLDLSDVHMTIFLPTSQAGRVELGSEARIVLDSAPEYVIPATVSFVAAEAQFTPKYVETANEREKLMYRIKLHIDPQILETYRGYVKAGMTGNAYVKVQAGGDLARQSHAEASGCPLTTSRPFGSSRSFIVTAIRLRSTAPAFRSAPDRPWPSSGPMGSASRRCSD